MTSEETLNLGVMYFNGEIVEQSYHKALALFKRAKKLGSKEVYLWLSKYYFYSDVIEYVNDYWIQRTEALLFKYATKAAEFNPQDAETLFILGRCYRNGWGIKSSDKKAFELFLKSAELGFKNSFCELTYRYYYGVVTKKDLRKALYWAEKDGNQAWIDKIKEALLLKKNWGF